MVIKDALRALPKAQWLEESRRWNALTDRVARRRKEVVEAPQHITPEFSRLYTEAWRESEGEHYLVRKAKAVRRTLEGIPVAIHEGELIVGAETQYVRGGILPPWSHAEDYLKQLMSPDMTTYGFNEASHAKMDEATRQELIETFRWWVGRDMETEMRKTLADVGLLQQREELGEARVFLSAINPGGHRCTDYEKLLTKGLSWVIAQAQEKIAALSFTLEDEPKFNFYKAVIIECEGIINWARRYAALAREMAKGEKDPARRKELQGIAEACEWVPANPARNLQEALQSHWFVFLGQTLEEGYSAVSPGRVDQMWFPYYQRDVEGGRLTRDQSAELIALFCIKLNEIVVVPDSLNKEEAQGDLAEYFALAGQTREGEDATNELTFLILQVLGQLRLAEPLASFRWHGRVFHDALIKALETNRSTKGGIPVFHSDLKKIPDLLEAGVSLADARDWIVHGCAEPCVPHSSAGFWINPPMGAAKQVELALYNGIDPRTGKQIGPATGDPRSFTTFDQFYAAWEQQFAESARVCHAIGRVQWAIRARWGPNLLTSALMNDCLDKGKTALEGGARYMQLVAIPGMTSGHQDVADTLTAIRELVFEKKLLTMDQVIKACQANFEGPEHERVRQLFLQATKYGNDDDEADSMLDKVITYTGEVICQQLSPYGKPQLPPMSPGVSWHYFHGTTVGALPSGRKAWMPLSDGTLSPMQGTDKKGPTAVLNSAAKVNLSWRNSVVLNQKVLPRTLGNREKLEKLAALLESYFQRGGYNLQINILDPQELIDAKKHPEKYRDLIVRVAGYSAYFVELLPEMQDEIIARTSQEI